MYFSIGLAQEIAFLGDSSQEQNIPAAALLALSAVGAPHVPTAHHNPHPILIIDDTGARRCGQFIPASPMHSVV